MAGKRITREIKTLQKMIALYQRAFPAPPDSPDYYSDLEQYATKRLEKCRFGEDKPACRQCPIHCYQPVKKEQVKAIMRWAGPKMLIYHPILAVQHLIDDRKPVPPIPEKKSRASSAMKSETKKDSA